MRLYYTQQNSLLKVSATQANTNSMLTFNRQYRKQVLYWQWIWKYDVKNSIHFGFWNFFKKENKCKYSTAISGIINLPSTSLAQRTQQKNENKSHCNSALTLLVGRQEEHPACKNWVMRCWCGYLSGVMCRLFAFGPADATAYQNQYEISLASFKSRLVLPFWYRLTQVVLEKRPLNGCSSSSCNTHPELKKHFSSCEREFLTYDLCLWTLLDSIKVNQHAKYLGQRSFSSRTTVHQKDAGTLNRLFHWDHYRVVRVKQLVRCVCVGLTDNSCRTLQLLN